MNDSEGGARRLARIQAGSGLAFFVFLALHLANTMLASFGAGAYDGLQRTLRPLYQAPVLEGSLIGLALIVHVTAGVKRMRLRGPARKPPTLRLRLHRLSAYFLSLFIVGHILATRGASLGFGVSPEFAGVSWAMLKAPLFFFPYYTLLALTGLYHGVHGSLLALGVLGVRVPAWLQRGPTFWLPVGASAVLLIASVLAFGGMLFPVPDASEHPYAQLAESFLARLR
jgi:succinate dehydrogenase/fumarate reductase cytochrome b subunit